MGRRRGRAAVEMDCDDFDAWCAATKKIREAQELTDESGGPRLSLVPLQEQNIAWPTDLLAPRSRKKARSRSPRGRSTGSSFPKAASGSPGGARFASAISSNSSQKPDRSTSPARPRG